MGSQTLFRQDFVRQGNEFSEFMERASEVFVGLTARKKDYCRRAVANFHEFIDIRFSCEVLVDAGPNKGEPQEFELPPK